MKKVKLWSVVHDGGGEYAVSDVPSVDNAETESLLENLLVHSPDLLMDGLRLIGRQVPTDGGPLDLLGIDRDGRLVVFELKRGSLTRDAVAQVLDYASDLSRMQPEQFASLVQESSGRSGIDQIDDFLDWYAQAFPDREGVLGDPPQMVLVGLGADTRALRIVDFLANAGINISLLTFNAFRQGDSFMLARQVESAPPRSLSSEQTGGPTKRANLQVLRANAEAHGVAGFIEEVAGYIETNTSAYKWPGKTGFAFSLTEYTEAGRPSLRVYVNVLLAAEHRNKLIVMFQERAVDAAGPQLTAVREALPDRCSISRYNALEIMVDPQSWASTRKLLEPALASMIDGWKARATRQGSASENTEAEQIAASQETERPSE